MDNLFQYNLDPDPLESFKQWYQDAKNVEENAEAMVLSTVDIKNHRPNSRFLLYKGMLEEKIIFYTNYQSPKSLEIEANPEVALTFYWHKSKRQVRINGLAEKMSQKDSQKYFLSRDKESQIASYVSAQSRPIEDRDQLLKKYSEALLLFKNKAVPCPSQWGGFLVTPVEIEFFIYGEHRLNDRFLYQLINQQWVSARLQP